MKKMKNPSTFIHHAAAAKINEGMMNFEFLFRMKKNDNKTLAMNIGSESPKPELQFRCGSKANNPAQTNAYFCTKNFLATIYTNGIVAVEITMLSILMTFEQT